MPYERLARFILLPELELVNTFNAYQTNFYETKKIKGACEVCPKCAKPSTSYYDKRKVIVKDEPLRTATVKLIIHKHRFWCKHCKKPFTEPIQGILPRRKTTQRFRKSILTACENYSDLSQVRKTYKCSSALVYKVLYEQLNLKWREYEYPWPKKIGIDEHFFSRSKGYREFATVVTDLTNRRLREVAYGKESIGLYDQLKYIQGRDNVKVVCMDLSSGYRFFARNFFQNADIVADKFHVLRLLGPSIFKELRNITSRRVKGLTKKLILMPAYKLDYFERKALWQKLQEYPKLQELYLWKERLHRFYRTHGYHRASSTLEVLLREMKNSQLSEVQTLRKTIKAWEKEILNYFKYRVTNATTEGFNNIAKLVQRRAFGYKSFSNYRSRVLNACA